MESMFHLIELDCQETTLFEMIVYQLARGNTFDMRVVGLEGIKRFRKETPDCAITFKPNHLSEADFILLGILFRENSMRVLTEGGANLFIDDIDIYQDLLPKFINHEFTSLFKKERMSIAQYLTRRGAFKVFREPLTIKDNNGSEFSLGKKDILSLTRAYRRKLVERKEMYVTFPGYSMVKPGLLDWFKRDGLKTGRSYTGKIDGFLHLPFQMDIEASLDTGVAVYIVDVNIAYEQVLEDENFRELARLHESGASKKEIYLKDLGFIVKEFFSNKRKGNLSIKFGQPIKLATPSPKDKLLGRKIKNAAHNHARESFDRVMSMQPIFPANIYFTAFDEYFNPLPIRVMKEKIDDMRNHLRTALWGKEQRRIDLHYVSGYNNHIVSADEIINRTFQNFNIPGRRITDTDGDMFVVYNKDVAMQYRNHTAHFFEEMQPNV
jgi:hypothetical protein